MCNERQIERWAHGVLSRRQFGALGGAAAVAACAPTMSPDAAPPRLTERRVSFPTADGTMDGFFVAPSEGPSPGVLFWPDIAGLREAKRQMARRLAGEGYAVLVVNPYYRDVTGEQFADFPSFAAAGGFQKVRPWRSKLNADTIGRDAAAAVAWLDQQEAVDNDRGIGTQGYCMGGPFTIWSAAAVPSRIQAAASFHGGGLVTDDPQSPHRMLDQSRAAHLIAIAQDDDAEAPDHKTILRQAAEVAGRDVVVRVYEGDHGWTVPDSPAYAPEAAELAYADLLTLYAANL